MTLPLRAYQARTLDALATYFDEAAWSGAKRAFIAQTERPYRTVPQLPDLPYVCLRVPTGGGKTLMAAHAVGITARHWVQHERVACLWLVPSNAIREQTLARLRDPADPYRQALASRFTGPVTVMDLREALALQRATLDGETVVIVATLAALRVSDTEGRKVYEANGALQHHFAGLPPELRPGLECRDDGTPVESLANALRLRRPVVVMDEAHNARTPLSFDTLARFAPSCVIEFTATPATRHAPDAGHHASNVLAHVSAAELKAEEMIKLPVRLWTNPQWVDAVTEALAMRRELEAVALREQAVTGERLRPILLFQAQPKREGTETVTPEVLRQALIDDHRIPAAEIAIETGTTRDLDGVDLDDPACPIRHVITVQALREGWDCPMAYVLCSVAEQASARAVEQLLGRVLRLPRARRKEAPALNRAYAYVVSPTFAEAARGLKDALVEAGFERLEADALVEAGPAGDATMPSLFAATPETPVARILRESPVSERVAELTAALRDIVRVVGIASGETRIELLAPVGEAAAEQLAGCFATAESRAMVRALARASRGGDTGGSRPDVAGRDESSSEARRADDRPLVIPQLAIRDAQGHLELYDETHLLDHAWRLAACDPVLEESEFPLVVRSTSSGEIDIGETGQLRISLGEVVSNQLVLLEGEPGWTLASLAVWLDAHIPHPDLTQADVRLFIGRVLEALAARAEVTVERLARDKYRLRKAIESRIVAHRAAQRRMVYQRTLFEGTHDAIVVGDEVALVLDASARYAPTSFYEGPFEFRKHLFRHVGGPLDGEERDCAVWLDQHPRVVRWVRNIPSRSSDSFWLQTATDRFYPDFVGELVDGRVFALEYKGEPYWSNDDSREKRLVGDLWAAASGGRCLFVMPRGTDRTPIEAAFAAVER
jgi:type III restriction enzyme